MTPKPNRRTAPSPVVGLLFLPAALALTVVLILHSVAPAVSADPDERAGVLRTLGLGGSMSNYTLQNNTGNYVTGMTFKFGDFSKSDILGTFINKSTWSTSLSEVSAGSTSVNTHIEWTAPSNVPSSYIANGQSGHFGFVLPAHLANVSVDEASWSLSGTAVVTYSKAVLSSYWRTPEHTVTPSATPVATPRPTAHSQSPRLNRLEVSVGSADAPLGPRIRAQELPLADPAWVAHETRNTWRPEDPTNDGTVLIQRSIKIIEYPQRLELAALIEDSDLVGSAQVLDEEPIALRPQQAIVTYVGPLPENARGALVYYTSRPQTPDRDGARSDGPSFTGYFAIPLETATPTLGPPATLTSTPTPTPTRRPLYLPHCSREHTLRPQSAVAPTPPLP